MLLKTLTDESLAGRCGGALVQRVSPESSPESLLKSILSFCAAVVIGCLIAGVLAVSQRVDACSAVAGAEGRGYLGANFDWRARGGIVFESPRSQIKTAVSPKTGQVTMTWVSRLASLTVSQFGRDFPMQGMNEAGLAGLVLMGQSGYPVAGALGSITENLWLQYQLDQYETVDQVVAHVQDLGIEKLSASLHWFFCDRSGRCAVVEFSEGRSVTYVGRHLDIRALTNSSYAAARHRFDAWRRSENPLPQGYDSFARFIRLAEMSRTPEFGSTMSSITAALDGVAAEGYTAWQTVFDLENRRFQIKLAEGAAGKSYWQTFDVTGALILCGPDLRMLVLGQDDAWKNYDHEVVSAMFADAAQGTQGLDAATRQRILRTSESVICDSATRPSIP
jgi:penicillin V acylase-like amidase (Ntn superfamily)